MWQLIYEALKNGEVAAVVDDGAFFINPTSVRRTSFRGFGWDLTSFRGIVWELINGLGAVSPFLEPFCCEFLSKVDKPDKL